MSTLPESPKDITIPKRRRLPWRRYVTPTETILSHPHRGQGTETDPYIVEWLPDDQENPMTWKAVSRIYITPHAHGLPADGMPVVVQMGKRSNRSFGRPWSNHVQ